MKHFAFALLLVLMVLGGGSCTKNTPISGEEFPLENVVVNGMVENLLAQGYELDRIQEYEDFYLVEDDLVFFKSELSASGDNERHYHGNNLVSGNYIGNGNVIKVYSTLPGPTGFGGLGTTWDEAVDAAMAAWNNIPNACINFQRTNDPSQADITVVNGVALPLGATQFGWSNQPLPNGAPFHTIWINMQYPNGTATLNGPIANTSFVQKRNIIAHELGHCIGFKHTDVGAGNLIPATSGTDPNSIMRDNLDFEFNTTVISAQDEFAVRWLYGSGDCVRNDPSDPAPTLVTLNPISSFCFPATFNASGTYLNVTLGTTTIELQVREFTGGLNGYQTIAVGQFTGGTFSFNNIDLGNIPGFTFNPNNPYAIRAVMTSSANGASASQSLEYDDCGTDPCQDYCKTIAGAIQTQNNGFGSYTFSIAPSVLNNPCAGSFTYQWLYSESNFTGTGSSYTVTLQPGSNGIALYIYYNGGSCHKETITINI